MTTSGLSRLGIAVVVTLLLAAIVSVVTASPATATTLQPLSVAQMTRHAVAVVAGEVVDTRAEETPSGVRTEVRLCVTRTFKGIGPRFMTVYVPGGVLSDGRQVVVSGMPSFRVGETSVVFVDVRGWVVGGLQGELDVSGDRVAATGQSLDAIGRTVKGASAARPTAAGGQEQVAAPPPASPAPHSAGGRAVSSVVITDITPPSAPAGTGSVVTINGSGFGTPRGQVSFSYGRKGVSRIAADSVRSWSDTSIQCVVPTGIIDDYAASAGSGPVVVTTAQGQESNAFSFEVPFGYGAAKWSSPIVTYRVNTAGVDDALRTSLLAAAAAMWNATGSRLTLVDGGATAAGVTPDGLNVITWADGLPYGVLAMTYSDRSPGVISEADIQFSNAFPWGEGTPGSGTYDIQSIAAHELGHWLVLLDQYMAGDAEKIMYGYGASDRQRRTPTSGDVAGIQWVYPATDPSPTPTPTPTPTQTVSPTPTPTPTALDTGPICRTKNVSVRRGAIATVRYVVTDDLDLVVTRSISVTTIGGVVKKKWTGVSRSSPSWQSFRFRCDLRKGSYRIVVRAEDLAGHPASVVGRASLTVK